MEQPQSFATSSRFRFRDHQEAENATESDSSSEISFPSFYSDNDDDESELQSMTGKGIKRLCMELLEIKAASDEDFYKNIFASYSAFVGICEEVKEMEKELLLLKGHVSTHKRLVNDLADAMYVKELSEETEQLIMEESELDEEHSSKDLESHINDVSETLDVLLSENKIDETIAILEVEEDNLLTLELDKSASPYLVMLYNSAISERKTMLTLQLTLVAENSRTTAPELQKALNGLFRLGDSHLVTQLLIRYYCSRLANGIYTLQNSKSFLHVVYVQELPKFVFSMISQAGRSFVMLFGENTPYTDEFMQWVQEEIEALVTSFSRHVTSISELSGGLSTAVEAVQFAMSYCSLLETQGLVLKPCLIKHIRPFMEKVLQIHIDHYKKVISIFTATDVWVLGRYLVSGIIDKRYSPTDLGQQPEYCLLTNSGRKFVTLLQAITKDIAPLAALQMDVCIIRGLMNLFMEYIAILEVAISSETNGSDRNGAKIVLSESVQQQLSILANLSTLEYFFCNTILRISGDINDINSETVKKQSVVQQQELDGSILLVQEAFGHLRDHFYEQFICRIQSHQTGSKLTLKRGSDSSSDHGMISNMIPSVEFQVLFLELRKLYKLAKDNTFEFEWLMDLLRGLIEAIFLWVSDNKDIWETNEGNHKFQHSDVTNQFILDMYFLMEITRYGEYFTEDPSLPRTLMKSAFISAGLNPRRDIKSDAWAIEAASRAVQRLLLDKEETESSEICSEYASEASDDDNRSSSDESPMQMEDLLATDASNLSANTERSILNAELMHLGQSSDILEDKTTSVDGAILSAGSSGDLESNESENAAYDKFHFTEETNEPHLLLFSAANEASEAGSTSKGQARSKNDETDFQINKQKDEGETAAIGSAFSADLQHHNGIEDQEDNASVS